MYTIIKMKFSSLNYKILIITLFFTFLVIFSIFDEKIYFYINKVLDHQKNSIKFADWIYVLNAALCHQDGANVLGNNYCDPIGRLYYQYPTTLLYLPFVKILYPIYLYLVPVSQIFFIIFFLNMIYSNINFQNFLKIFLIIFSTPIILGFERGNIELLVFCLLIIISLQKNLYITQFLIYIITQIKFYPLVSIIVLYFEKFNKKLLFSSVIFFLLILLFFSLQIDVIKVILNHGEILRPTTVENVGIIIFGFNVIPDLVKTTLLHYKYSNINFIYSVTLFLLILINFFLTFYYYKNNKKSFPIINIIFFEDKLFFYSSFLLITLYFITMSYAYREIYLLGLIPFLINKKNKKNIISLILKKIIYFKLIGMTFFWIFQSMLMPKSLIVKGLNILIKGILDNVIIIFLIIFVLKMFEKSLEQKKYVS